MPSAQILPEGKCSRPPSGISTVPIFHAHTQRRCDWMNTRVRSIHVWNSAATLRSIRPGARPGIHMSAIKVLRLQLLMHLKAVDVLTELIEVPECLADLNGLRSKETLTITTTEAAIPQLCPIGPFGGGGRRTAGADDGASSSRGCELTRSGWSNQGGVKADRTLDSIPPLFAGHQ